MVNEKAIALALKQGESLAAADQVLINPRPGDLVSMTTAAIAAIRKHACTPAQEGEALILLGRNFVGREAVIVGYKPEERDDAFKQVLAALDSLDLEIQKNVVESLLADMQSVNGGDSLPGLWAERIREKLNQEKPAGSFLIKLGEQIHRCVYTKMVEREMGKFGNDFARGLGWMRSFYCQVSTNPVLAWKAYLEDLGLREKLKSKIAEHSDWLADPEAYKFEIAMQATLLALWPNLTIFRPLACVHRSY